MKFYCFPKQQDHFIVYSSVSAFRSRLFSNFIIQASPKNSLFFRLRRTLLGHLIGHLSTIAIEVPTDANFVGIIKKGRILLVELERTVPTNVWRQDQGTGEWKSERFVGYQLIEKYTKHEFHKKLPLMVQALQERWDQVVEDKKSIHGDFTHFNILVDERKAIHVIDPKKMENSPLYDFFYFYAYLRQCLSRCSTLSKPDEVNMVTLLEQHLRRICSYDSKEVLLHDLDGIQIPLVSGLNPESKQNYLERFTAFMTA